MKHDLKVDEHRTTKGDNMLWSFNWPTSDTSPSNIYNYDSVTAIDAKYNESVSELGIDALLTLGVVAPPSQPPSQPPSEKTLVDDKNNATEENKAEENKTTSTTSTSLPPLNPIAYVLYVGNRKDTNSILYKLPIFLLQKIYVEHILADYKSNINYKGVFASIVASVKFPISTDININMMPIIIGNRCSIPKEYHQYIPLLMACPINRSEYGKIGYLTIHESVVEEDQTSQRRKGAHTESPGTIYYDPKTYQVVKKSEWNIQHDSPMTVAWGCGNYHENFKKICTFEGGIYMASNVTNSTKVWNCEIKDVKKSSEKSTRSDGVVVDEYGGLEKNQMHHFLDKGNVLKAGEMCWMTDTTPHESLALAKGTARSYFRLVTSDISVWFEEHSTKNPYGVIPPSNVVILKGNKFIKKANSDVEQKVEDKVEEEERR